MSAVAATTEPTETITAAWFHNIFRDIEAGWVNLFSLNRTTGERSVDWAHHDDLDRLASIADKRAEQCDVWFGVATRTEHLGAGKRGGIADCAQIVGLWLDLDIAGPNHADNSRLPTTEAQAMQIVAQFPLPPSIIVRTGGGLQPWWLLDEPLNADEAAPLLVRWAATWKAAGDTCGYHVDNVFEIARVMRLPGTYNRKQGTPVAVTTVGADWNARYGAQDIDDHLTDPPIPTVALAAIERPPYIGPDRPGDAYNLHHSGSDVLASQGWTLDRTDPSGDQHWVRPGKPAKDGSSATVYAEDGHTTIWSDTVAAHTGCDVRRPYDPFGLYTALVHRGEFRAATDALVAAGYGTPKTDGLTDMIVPVTNATMPVDPPAMTLPTPVDWATVWDEQRDPEWLIEPIIPSQRHTVLYAPAKMGKSLLALELAAKAATGGKWYGHDIGEPIRVVYLDFEMTVDDVLERLGDMGYDKASALEPLAYYSLPDLPALDTQLGGDTVVKLAKAHRAQLVIIDTMARVVTGEENSADTYRQFDRCTSLPLKREGIAVLRLDHAGKDVEKGQRGSSEKNGYADLVWSLVVTETGQTTLRATHRRIGWAPTEVMMQREVDPLLRHIPTTQEHLEPGVADTVRALTALGISPETSTRDMAAALKVAGRQKRRQVVVAAKKLMLREAQVAELDALIHKEDLVTERIAAVTESVQVVPGTTLKTGISGNHPNGPEPLDAKHGLTSTGTTWEPPEPLDQSTAESVVPPPKGGTTSSGTTFCDDRKEKASSSEHQKDSDTWQPGDDVFAPILDPTNQESDK